VTVAGGSLLLALLLPGSAAAPAYASCAFDPDHPELVQVADVIFTGHIVSDTVSRWGQERQVLFAVERVYKGKAQAEQLVVSDTRSSVAFTLKRRGRLLIQAQRGESQRDPGVLTVTSCSGSRAGNAPASLGAGYPPVPGSTLESQQRHRTQGAGVAGLALLIAVAGFAFARRRLRSRSAR